MTPTTDITALVQRALADARRRGRAPSVVDEQAWFDAGEPDTVPELPRIDLTARRRAAPRAAPPRELRRAVLAVVAVAAAGFWLGFALGRWT